MSIRRCTRGMLNAMGEPAFLVDYKDEHGVRRTRRTEACTLKDAQRIERSILTEIDKAKALGVSRAAINPTTFASFAETVYLPWIKNNIRESTYKRYQCITGHLTDHFGSWNLATITPSTIEDYFQKAEKETTHQGRTPGAGELVNRRARLGAILQLAVNRRLIQVNPVHSVKRRKYKETKRHIFSADEERKVLEAAPGWLKPFIVIGLYGGLRESEICAMKWEDIKGSFIHIPDSKTGEPRYVPINREIKAVLDAQDRVIVGGKPVAYVFWNASVLGPFKPNSISEGFGRVARDTDLPATFHCTRHTFITRIRDAGVNDARVMAITGHKTPRMLQHYTNLGPKELSGATEVLCRKDATQVQHGALAK